MLQPRRTIINYDERGNVAGIEHRVLRASTADFGDGAEPVQKQSIDQLPSSRISTPTKTAIKKFLGAFEADVVADRKRIADHMKAEAARVEAEAQDAAARAKEKPL